MKRKGLISILIATLMLVGMLSVVPLGSAQPTTLRFMFTDVLQYDVLDVTTDPAGAYRDLFDSFTVEWIVEDVPDLTVWGCAISWDPTVLQCTSAAYGPSFKAVDPACMQMPYTIDNVMGTIQTPGESLTTGSVSGTTYPNAAILFTTTFYVIGYGATPLAWTMTSLLDSTLTEITRTDIPGHFDNTDLIPPPFSPTAAFTYSPLAPYDGDTVTFDASGSTGGFDGFNPCPIQDYRWDFENDGVVDAVTALDTIDHIFSPDGTYFVNLTVYAPGVPDPPGPYDTLVLPVVVYPLAVGPSIDVYTHKVPYDGKGYWMPSDACEPGEEVTLYAVTTYNMAPVAGQLVTFTVIGWNQTAGTYNIIWAVKSNMTLQPDGITWVKFRIPEECDPTINFGTWVCAAQAEIAEVVVQDWVSFQVGWIVELMSVFTIDGSYMPADTFRRDECVGVFITYKNIAWVTKYAVFTVTIKDEVGHPIAWSIIGYDPMNPLVPTFPCPPGDPVTGDPYIGVIPFYCYLPIPKWAFPGVASVEVSCLKGIPWLFPPSAGTPYCPEVSCSFFIAYP